MENNFESVVRYIKKKGIEYFILNPTKEEKEAFEGIIYQNGYPNLSLLYAIANRWKSPTTGRNKSGGFLFIFILLFKFYFFPKVNLISLVILPLVTLKVTTSLGFLV